MKKITKTLIVLSILSIILPTLTLAENTKQDLPQTPPELTEPIDAPEPSFAQEDTQPPEGTTNCFDYYTFGSVQVDVSPTLVGTVNGVPITFKGTIKNNNPYPIVDGTLYVKVFKLRDSQEKNANGPFVVDQYVVLNQLSLPAHGSMPVTFSWKVPAHATTGNYQLATFFTTSKKFNLLGLAFTDDVVGNTANFKVIGETNKGVTFDKDSVKITDGENTQDYYFAAFPPRMSDTAPVTLTSTIKNTTKKDQIATVRWDVFQWDQQRRENRISTETQTYTIKANSTKKVTHTITDNTYPVYLTVATLKYKDTKSILNIRFVRENKNRLRINFPAVTDFPLKKDKETTLFSCLHNTANQTPNGELHLTLEDTKGNLIHEYTYKGGVTGAMMGVKDNFTPKKDYDKFTLKADLFQEGSLVDTAYLDYDCMQIDPSACMHLKKDASGNIVYDDADTGANTLNTKALQIFGLFGLFGLLGLLVVGLIVFLWKRK